MGISRLLDLRSRLWRSLLRRTRSGSTACKLNFYDFKPDLEYFGEKILPLPKKAGLRVD